MTSVRPFDRLIGRLIGEGYQLPYPWELDLRRTYAGYWQRAAGAWSWVAYHEGREVLASQYPVRELAKCKSLKVSPDSFTPGVLIVDPGGSL